MGQVHRISELVIGSEVVGQDAQIPDARVGMVEDCQPGRSA